jgi:hypothetical protein
MNNMPKRTSAAEQVYDYVDERTDGTYYLVSTTLDNMTAKEVLLTLEWQNKKIASFAGLPASLDLPSSNRLSALYQERIELWKVIKAAMPGWQDASRLTITEALQRFWPRQ